MRLAWVLLGQCGEHALHEALSELEAQRFFCSSSRVEWDEQRSHSCDIGQPPRWMHRAYSALILSPEF